MIKIRETGDTDFKNIFDVEKNAFGYEKEANLVKDLLGDETAKPLTSLLAFDGDKAVGHILFTKAELTETEDSANISILAPLAVIPEYQKKGIGGKLILEGIERLKKSGVDLLFVLGHPEYYPRYGFSPAGVKGYDAPYPIPSEYAGAWMVQELKKGVITKVRGKVKCSEQLNKPEHWRE